MDADQPDPILARRERIRKQAGIGQRIGYLAFGLATIGFFIGLIFSFSSTLVSFVVAMLIVGSIILAVAIQVGYAIRGAERHEEDAIAMRRKRN